MSDDAVFDSPVDDAYGTRTANWTRWVPEPFHSAPPPTQADALATQADDVSIRLKNSLARLRERAREQGHNDGYTKGHAEGRQQGLEDGRKQGHEEGYRAGYEAGHNEGREHAEKAANDLAKLAHECAASLAEIEADIGQELITLAIRIAEQVVHRTVKAEPETLLSVVNDILRMDTGKSAILQLYVHPDDLKMVSQYVQDNPDTSLWRVVPDEAITPGGCKARTALGEIDATLETRWQRIVTAIGGSI